MPTTLSIVIPVFNEVQSLATLQRELGAVAAEHDYRLEVVFVDDGSTDGSWQEVQRLAREDGTVQGVRLRRNFGKAAALSAGVAASSAPIVITMDADLQDDPAEIPRFLEAMGTELDLVSGWKRTRHDPWHKVGPSRVFNGLVSGLTGVRLHDHNCGFKCYRREVFDEIRLYGERHRFIPVLAEARGFRVGEIEVHHRPRQFGQSKYGLRRFVKGFLDLLTVYFLTGFGQRPQHLLGTLGLLCFLLGGTGLGILSVWRIVSWQLDTLEPIHLHERAVFYYSIVAVLLGAQFMTIGFLAEMITESCGRDHQPYSIKERTRP